MNVESITIIVSAIVGLVGGAISIAQFIRQRRKDEAEVKELEVGTAGTLVSVSESLIKRLNEELDECVEERNTLRKEVKTLGGKNGKAQS